MNIQGKTWKFQNAGEIKAYTECVDGPKKYRIPSAYWKQEQNKWHEEDDTQVMQ